MSMQNYPEHGFGLVLTGDAIEEFVKLQTNGEIDDPYEYLEEAEEKEHTVRFYDSDSEGASVTYVNKLTEEKFCTAFEGMLVVWAEKQPDAFKAVYADLDEFVEELKKEFVFPENFDFAGHVGYFHLCVYC